MTQNGATPAQLNALSKPVPPKYIKTDDKGNSFVTARFIMNLLDSTVGKANWKDSYRLIMIGAKAVVECTLSVKVNGEWVGKADVGGPAKTFSPEKSLYSGALKRAAFRWGIARELYGEGNYYVTPDAPAPTSEDDTQPEPSTRHGEIINVPAAISVWYFDPDESNVNAAVFSFVDEHAGNSVAGLMGPYASYEEAKQAHGDRTQQDAPEARDVLHETGVGEDDDAPFANNTAKFDQLYLANMGRYMVDEKIADHVNHAGNTIAEAMQEMYTAATWPEIYTYSVCEVWAAVLANRAADAAAKQEG